VIETGKVGEEFVFEELIEEAFLLAHLVVL